MSCLPLRTAIAVVLLAAAAPVTVNAANNNADSIYKYPAYGQQGSPASGAQPTINPPPVDRSYEENAPSPGAGDDEPTDDTRGAPYPPEDDSDLRVTEPPLPRTMPRPPPPRLGGRARITATASAPDRRIPYDVRAHDARRAAIDAWRGKVAERFGPAFSHWRIAAHRRVNCRPARHDDVVCTVSGEPVRGNGRDRRHIDDY